MPLERATMALNVFATIGMENIRQEVLKMEEKELYTVAEIAQIAGLTSQAIYKRLATNLKPFVKVLNGKKLLHRDVLSVLLLNTTTNENQKTNFSSDELTASLTRTIEILQHQLTVKDKQINELNAALAQSLKNTDTAHIAAAIKQLEAPGQKRSWLEKIFNK